MWSIEIGRGSIRRSATIPGLVRMSGVVPGQVDMPEPASMGLHRLAAPHPVLLVNGLGSSASGWHGMITALQRHGVTVAAFSYPVFGTSVEQLAEGVAEAVGSLLNQTGAAKLQLVGHSLGGVVIAQALASGRLADNVDIVVTMGAPFGGSPWANLLPFSATVRSLRRGSPQLRRLADVPWSDGVRWVAITAGLDKVVPGDRARPARAGVEIVAVEGAGHIGLRVNPCVIDRVVRILAREPAAQRAVA